MTAPGQTMPPVELRFGAARVACRVVTSSGADREARVLVQMILEYSEWIGRVRGRFFGDPPSRRERVERVQTAVGAALLVAGVTDATQQAQAAALIARELDAVLPAAPGEELPELATPAVAERLARVREARREALYELLRLQLDSASSEGEPDTAPEAALAIVWNRLLDDAAMEYVLDQVMG